MLRNFFFPTNFKRHSSSSQSKCYQISNSQLVLEKDSLTSLKLKQSTPDEEQYGYDIANWIEGDSMEPLYKSEKSH